MKRTYRKNRYTKSIVNGVQLWLVLFVLLSSFGPLLVSAEVVWEDNFDDGNCDDWILYYTDETTRNGTYSAADGYLECTELAEPQERSLIYHECNVSTGTWSFDCYLPSDDSSYLGLSLLNDADVYCYLFIQVTSTSVALWLDKTFVGGDFLEWVKVEQWFSNFNGIWTHIDVTVDENSKVDVFVDNTHRISYTNSSPILSTRENRYFRVDSRTIGQAIDNVVVKDTIDESLTFNTDLHDDGFDMTMILLAGGGIAAIVVVVLVVWKVRRRA
ncbi:MAG: hypothetical protein ACFFAZ_11245 [Promethearchaeota archaeon]